MTRGYGTVYLVGAGPGDPELLTVRAHRLIGQADVVLHDSLVGERIVSEVPPATATVTNVGKRPDTDRRWRQAEINRYMVRKAETEETVVRLKGGDPTVFGRGGEEAEYLAENDVPFEFVPGVTSAIAAPEVAGIPVTHRECASSLTVVTGHEDPTKETSRLDWDAIADTVAAGGTLVVLMGVSRLPENVRLLRERGLEDETPVAVVEKATTPDESVTIATLETVVERTREADVEPPATVVVGAVVKRRQSVLTALGESPLRSPIETREAVSFSAR